MAGIAGIEPTSYGSKPYTLTTMLNPYTSLVCPRCQASVRFVNTCVFFPYCQSVFPDSQKGNYMNNRRNNCHQQLSSRSSLYKAGFSPAQILYTEWVLVSHLPWCRKELQQEWKSSNYLLDGARLRIRTEITKQFLDLLSNSACRYQPATLHIVSDLCITHLHLYYIIRFSFYTADY